MNSDLGQVRGRSSVEIKRSARNDGQGDGQLEDFFDGVFFYDRESALGIDDRVVQRTLGFKPSAGVPTKGHRGDRNMASEERVIGNEGIESK